MGESGRHQELWRQLHREVIRGLEEEVEMLRLRDSELRQSAKEREIVLLELLEVERAARAAADTGAAQTGEARPSNPPRGAEADARAAELMARLSLTDSRIPELEAALRACEQELAMMRNRKAFRAIDALVKFKRRLIG